VERTPSRLPLASNAREARPTIEVTDSGGRGFAIHQPISEPTPFGGPLAEKSRHKALDIDPLDDTNDTAENANKGPSTHFPGVS
jgi:hypothetical protein